MKILVIGGGIYGCHLALFLKNYGINVKLFEKNSNLFEGSSGNNQYRLHKGFHYARSYKTRFQSKIGFDIFLKSYSEHTIKVEKNYYLIPFIDSLIDFGTYISIFQNENYEFEFINDNEFDFLKGIEGGFKVDERVIDTNSLSEMFKNKLKGNIEFNKNVLIEELDDLKNNYDFIFDCTWGRLIKKFESIFELTHLCYIKSIIPKHPAITLVDGPLWSIYPTSYKDIFTLSSVKYTPILKNKNLNKIIEKKENISDLALVENYQKMIKQVEINYPTFKNNFKLIGHQLSIKNKPLSRDDSRECKIFKEDNLISVFSGKIDTFYIVEEFIKKNIL